MDIIPSDLATYGKDAKALLKELQSQNERMFLLTFLVMNTGSTEQELETNVFQASSIAQKYNCSLRRLDFQQEQGLMSSLPLAQNLIEIQRGMTTSSTAIFVPFTTQELFQTGKEALYYGLNALSNNLIMVDRKLLKNPNGLILGTPGSGKSFSAKREITNAFLVTDDDVIICDPEAEYTALVQKLEGQVIKISPSSTQYINPMDINSNYSEEDNPIALNYTLCDQAFHELSSGQIDNLEMSINEARDAVLADQGWSRRSMTRVGYDFVMEKLAEKTMAEPSEIRASALEMLSGLKSASQEAGKTRKREAER